jgi:undecaprenyl-diphosphatase
MALFRSGSEARGGASGLGARIEQFDHRVDDRVERMRGSALDPVFYGLSSAADHGLLWLALGSIRAAARRDPSSVLRLAAVLGTESALTNGPIKAVFRRVRPPSDDPPGPLPYGMHRPITSSFPSGHAASAFTAAVVLAGGPETPALFVLAGAIAFSRVYTRMHHTSDVVAGSLVGLAMGSVARRILGGPA